MKHGRSMVKKSNNFLPDSQDIIADFNNSNGRYLPIWMRRDEKDGNKDKRKEKPSVAKKSRKKS